MQFTYSQHARKPGTRPRTEIKPKPSCRRYDDLGGGVVGKGGTPPQHQHAPNTRPLCPGSALYAAAPRKRNRKQKTSVVFARSERPGTPHDPTTTPASHKKQRTRVARGDVHLRGQPPPSRGRTRACSAKSPTHAHAPTFTSLVGKKKERPEVEK